MEDHTHTVDVQWLDAEALALETKVSAINDWLDHTEFLVRVFDGDEAITPELRGVAGTLRSRRNDFDTAAAKLREELNGIRK
jgi:hypothetical protein